MFWWKRIVYPFLKWHYLSLELSECETAKTNSPRPRFQLWFQTRRHLKSYTESDIWQCYLHTGRAALTLCVHTTDKRASRQQTKNDSYVFKHLVHIRHHNCRCIFFLRTQSSVCDKAQLIFSCCRKIFPFLRFVSVKEGVHKIKYNWGEKDKHLSGGN